MEPPPSQATLKSQLDQIFAILLALRVRDPYPEGLFWGEQKRLGTASHRFRCPYALPHSHR